MSIEQFDIVILGGGPAGYTAAIRASQLGKKTCLIEMDKPGGTCLWRGCIPTKALLQSTLAYSKFQRAADFGITVEGVVRPDFTQMISRKNNILNILGVGIKSLLKSNGVTVLSGKGNLKNSRTLEVLSADGTEQVISADNILLCTGSSPAEIPGFAYDGTSILSTTDILNLTRIPESLLIIGAGYTGCEFAFMFAELGTRVTVVEMLPQPLPNDDREITDVLSRQMRKKKIQLHAGTKILAIDREADNSIRAHLSSGTPVRAEIVLIAVGRSLNHQGLGLKDAGIKQGPRGEILVNDKLETNIPGIYAAGDITGKLLLAHVASAQSVIAVENICGMHKVMNYDIIPSCCYTHPPVARIGLTEAQCSDLKLKYHIGRFQFRTLGASQASGEIDGMVKMIAEVKTDRILGVHIIGLNAPEIIHEAVAGMYHQITATALGEHIRAHPSYSEALMEACHELQGKSIHTFPTKEN